MFACSGKVEACHEKSTDPALGWSKDFRNGTNNSSHAGFLWDAQSSDNHCMVALVAFGPDGEGDDSEEEEEEAGARNRYWDARKCGGDCIVLPTALNHYFHNLVVGQVLRGADSGLDVGAELP